MQRILDAIGPRLTEPSTWAGVLTAIGSVCSWAALPPELAGPVSTALAGIASVVLVIIREHKS